MRKLLPVAVVVVAALAFATWHLLRPEPGSRAQATACHIDPADGHQAIEKAIQQCPDGSTVLFPSGKRFTQGGSIRVERRADLIIDGNGSIFEKTVVTTPGEVHPNWLLIDNRNLVLRNMKIIGTFHEPGPRSPERVGRMGPNQFDSGIIVYGSRDTTLADLAISNTFGDLVSIVPTGLSPWGSGSWAVGEFPTNIRIERLTGRSPARQGVAPTGVRGFWLVDSDIRDCWYWCVDAEADVADEPLQDVHILNNVFAGTYFGYVTVPAPGVPGAKDGIEIRGNRMLEFPDAGACAPAIQITYWPDTGLTVSNVIVEDNDVKAAAFGITYRDVANGAIRGNRLERATDRCGPLAGLDEPISVVNSDVAVEGNKATGWP